MPDNSQLSDADFLNLIKNPDQLDSFLDAVAGRIEQVGKTLAKEAPYTPLIPTPNPQAVDLSKLAPMVVDEGVPIEKEPESIPQNTLESDVVPKPQPSSAQTKRVDVVPPVPVKTQAPSMVSQTVPQKATVQPTEGVPKGIVDEAAGVVAKTPVAKPQLPKKTDIKLKEVDDATSLKAREKKIQDMLKNDKGQTI